MWAVNLDTLTDMITDGRYDPTLWRCTGICLLIRVYSAVDACDLLKNPSSPTPQKAQDLFYKIKNKLGKLGMCVLHC